MIHLPSYRTSLVCIGLLMATFAFAQAQDTLTYTDGRVVAGTVEEIGVNEVRFRTGAGEGVRVTVDKREFRRVKLRSGETFDFGSAPDGVASAEFLQRKNIVSLDVLAPALDHVTVGYELFLGDRMSLAARVGYIGLGSNSRINGREKYAGGLVKVGVKFVLPKGRRKVPHVRDEHPLAGWYLKPELMYSAWSSEDYFYPYYDPYYTLQIGKDDYASAALDLVIGRQVFLGDRISFDIYGGLGYGIQWVNGVPNNNNTPYGYRDRQEYSFSHAFLGNYTPLIVSGGMNFGVLF